MTRYLIGDIESTGLHEDAGVVDLAWLEIDDDLNVVDSFETLVDPEQEIKASASGTHGLTYDDVKDAPTIEEVFSIVRPDPFENITLIAHNCKFDYRFLSPYMDIQQTLCTLRAARRYVTDADDHKLTTLKYHLGLSTDFPAHRAMGDVMTTYELLATLVMLSGQRLPDLVETMSKPMLLETVNFGKFKGRSFMEVPHEYLRWILEKDFDEDTKHTAKHTLEVRFGR